MSSNGQRAYWEPIERGEYGFSRYTWKCSHCNKWSNELLPECPGCNSEMVGTIYLCNPDLAKTCSKSHCFTNGGECRHTTKIEQARQANEVGLDKWSTYDLQRQNRRKRT